MTKRITIIVFTIIAVGITLGVVIFSLLWEAELSEEEKLAKCDFNQISSPVFVDIYAYVFTLPEEDSQKLSKINTENCQIEKTVEIQVNQYPPEISVRKSNQIYVKSITQEHLGRGDVFDLDLNKIGQETLIDECYLFSPAFNLEAKNILAKSCKDSPQLDTAANLIAEYSINTPKKPSVFEREEIRLVFTGDAMLALSMGKRIKNGGDLFRNMEETFSQADYVVLNLETNMSTPGVGQPAPQKVWTFNAPIEAASLMKNAGVDIVNLANNHTCDYGRAALMNQMKNLNSANLIHFGAGKNIGKAFEPTIVESKGVKIAFLGFNAVETYYSQASKNSPGTAHFDKKRIKKSVSEARKKADVVLVSAHAGTEQQTIHNSYQQRYYRLFIDSGADAVIGHHPHVRQDYEKYKGKMIYYSLGNFIFETGDRANYKKAYLAELVIDTRTKKLKNINLIDIKLVNGIPVLARE